MSKFATPVVLSDDGARHEAMREGEEFSVDAIPVSTSRLNLLETDPTGLLLTGEMLVSKLEHNPAIVNTDGRVYVRTKLMLSPEDQVMKVSDNLMRADLSLAFDPAASKLSLIGRDKTVISDISLPVAPGLPTVVEILQDTVPPKPEGFTENPYKKGTYLHMRFRTDADKTTDIYLDMSKLVDVYTGGRGVTVADNVISIMLKEGGGLTFGECCADPGCACPVGLAVDIDPASGLTLTGDGKVGIDIEKLSSILVERVAEKLAVGVSADRDNILSLGSDNKPYLPGDQGSL